MYIDTKFETKVHIPYGQLKTTVQWCKENCERDWGYSILDNAGNFPGNYIFKFESEKDLLTFLLYIS